MDKIIMQGMEFYGYHGVFPAERELGQRFIVDLECYMPLDRAGKSDSLEDTINYAEVYELVKAIMAGKPVNLLETLGERISNKLLERYKPLQAVKVKVIKPGPPIPGNLQHVAVELYRSRNHE